MYTGGYHDRDRRIRKVPIRSDDSDGVGIFIPAQEHLCWLNVKNFPVSFKPAAGGETYEAFKGSGCNSNAVSA